MTPHEKLAATMEALSPIERAVFAHQLHLFGQAKTKAWRTRRLNEFTQWLERYRSAAEEAAA